MINGTIKNIYIKGSNDRYPDAYPIIKTDKHFYCIDLGGFEGLPSPDLTAYKIYNMTGYKGYENADVRGATIIEVYANGEIIYIVLSDNRVVILGLAEDSLELLVDEYEKELQEWFESPEPREAGLQRLTKEHPRCS